MANGDEGIARFQEEYPSLDSYWRSVVLFGRNVATYKFALAESLLDLASKGVSSASLEDLAGPFASNMCRHVAESPRQATGKPGKFITACQSYNEGAISEDELRKATVDNAFGYVLDAFHTVSRQEIPVRFFEVQGKGKNRKVDLTDETFWLLEGDFGSDLSEESEARWNLVQLAWDTGISSSLLNVKYDPGSDVLYVDPSLRRRDVTSARDALNGYQKGHCFYCYEAISLDQDSEHACDVDHFYPHALNKLIPDVNFDGVWNLVLSCKECNRGKGGKFDSVPAIKYLERLSKRNEFLIGSHHPLRETLMRQTGSTQAERRLFLAGMDKRAVNLLIHRWETEERSAPVF